MTEKQIRNWLGLYFLLTTGVTGAVILLFGNSLLHLDDTSGTFQIIIPVLAGQLAIIFKWYTADSSSGQANREMALPSWVVKGPPIMAIVILALAMTLKVIGFYRDLPLLAPSDDQFKGIVTFCVALLNGTTVYVIGRYFGRPAGTSESGAEPAAKPKMRGHRR